MEKQLFPGYRFNPDTGEGQIFESAAEVPAGWTDNQADALAGIRTVHNATAHPKPAVAPPPPPTTSAAPAVPPPPPSDAPPPPPAGEGERDAAGVLWDPAKHAGTKAKVKSGLWRMKVGVSRPAGEGEEAIKAPPPPPPLNL